MNITDVIWRNSFAYPERIAVICDGKPATYATLRITADLAAARLEAAGVGRGDCVAVSVRNPFVYLVVVLAAARIGATATPFKGNWTNPQKEELLTRHAVHTLIQDAHDNWRTQAQPGLRYLRCGDLFLPPPAKGLRQAALARDADQEPWLIALSSGTTGTPKSVPMSHQRGALVAILSGNEVVSQRMLVLVDMGVALGLLTVLIQLYAGRTVVLTQSGAPGNFFSVVRRDQPDHVLMGTGLAASLVAYPGTSGLDGLAACSSVRSVMLGGSVVTPALHKAVVQNICPELLIAYGATEIGRVATLTSEAVDLPAGCAGRLHPWVQGQAVDEQDRPLPAGQPGLLRFRSPVMVQGYLNDEKATARAFRDGWYYPGDMGAVDRAGYLSLAGRRDDLLNIGGTKLDPYQIEAVLNSHAAILESAVVAAPNEGGLPMLVAVVVAQGPYEAKDLMQLCRDKLGPSAVPMAVVSAPTLPKNEAGKIMRRKLATMIRRSPQGALPRDRGG